jgi:hypothetical protein
MRASDSAARHTALLWGVISPRISPASSLLAMGGLANRAPIKHGWTSWPESMQSPTKDARSTGVYPRYVPLQIMLLAT